jgi:glycosyltransferase involved in cell wall biosynthesis
MATVTPRAVPSGTIDVRRELGLAPATPVIYAAGPLVPQAGNRIAVWAVNILNYLHPDVRLVVHGEGSERERLEHFAQSIDQARRVHFVPASWSVSDLVAQADQVWLPRQEDGVPDALFLALQQGKPIVASRQQSLQEWLQHDVNGILVRPDQPAEWAAAGKRLLEDGAYSHTLATAAAGTGLTGVTELPVFEAPASRRMPVAA